MRKRIVAVIVMLTFAISSNAIVFSDSTTEDVIYLSVKKAANMAVQESPAMESLNDAIEQLEDGYVQAVSGARQMQNMLDAMERYQSFYERKQAGETLSRLESVLFTQYQAMFGKEPPVLAKQEEYLQYVKTIEVVPETVATQLANVRIDRELLNKTLENAMENLYSAVFNLENGLENTRSYYELVQRQVADSEELYKQGQIPEIDLIRAKNEAQKALLNVQQMERQIENATLSIKQMSGIEFDQEIVLVQPLSGSSIVPLLSYDVYLEQAMKNRGEVKKQEALYADKKMEMELMSQYITNPDISYRVEVDYELLEEEIRLNEVKQEIEQDVYTQYIETKQTIQKLGVTSQTYENAAESYKHTQALFDQGMISESTRLAAEVQFMQALMNNEAARRSYKDSYNKLMDSIGY